MQERRFKLIKEFPLSPSLGFEVLFETEKDFNDGMNNVGAISTLMISDCTKFPQFWEEIIEEEESHRFYIDEPCKVWRRYWYDIPGTYEDAVAYMKKEVINMDLDDPYFDESEPIDDTEEYTGEPRELFDEQGEQL